MGDIVGTTRDALKETIHVNGMPLNIIDTAGLHASEDKVEQEGIKRAHVEIERADVVLMVFDAQDKTPDLSILPSGIDGKPILLIKNKVDLTDEVVGITHISDQTHLSFHPTNHLMKTHR